ncbi:Ribosomal protein L1 [Pleurostoma richardsiae]|uniref:Ribosomal protein L1 n=1 Tax=Pleurostoma richardsiae TaxID=41990 RepID=A0AA38VLZ1_9PEZI|nr:Ribosomal protein L1 [Pleurostoma richardsiae]
MADSKTLLRKGDSSSFSVSPDQTLKASKALLAHIKKASKEKATKATKKNLLEDPEDEEHLPGTETPVYLTLTTKRHINESPKLKPGKIPLPYPLNTDPEITICLISASPQRAYKNLIASSQFPEELRKRITRVVDLEHLRAKFKSYEAQRKLHAEHDIFLGDDRIINRLPKALGKSFYKNTTKRPVPVALAPERAKVDGKRVKREKGKKDEVNAKAPAEVAAEIEKAIGSAFVHLTPSTNTSVKIGYAGMKAEQLAANAQKVAEVLVAKFIPHKESNVRSIYIKGPETAALPIFQTEELWLEADTDVVADGSEQAKAIEAKKEAKKEKANIGKKRKSLEGGYEAAEEEPKPKKAKKAKKEKEVLPESNDDRLDREIAERKAKLKQQKKAAKAAMEE